MSPIRTGARQWAWLNKVPWADVVAGLLCVMLLYGSYVSVMGYPEDWDRVHPESAVADMTALYGPPQGEEEKYGEQVWYSLHLLGWYELQAADRGVVYIYSHIGVPGFSLEKLLVAKTCSNSCITSHGYEPCEGQ